MSNFISRRVFVLTTLAGVAATPFSRAFATDAWPNRPIRLLVPYSAGSGTDILARALAEQLGPALGQSIVIENKPGASGAIATMVVVKAPADGCTLLYSNAGGTVMAEATIPTLPFKTLRDLVPVGVNAVGGVILVVNPQVPARTLPELIDLIKRNPDKYSYGTPAVGSNGHLTMEWLKQRTGMKTSHVPYKSSPVLLTDIISGVIPIGWVDLSSPLPFIQQGKLRAIAINGNKRNPQVPNLPTMTEQGYPFPATGFQGIFAPAGTPAAIVQRLNSEINKVLGKPEYQATLRRLNVDAPPQLSPAQFSEMIANDQQTWTKIAREANVQLDS